MKLHLDQLSVIVLVLCQSIFTLSKVKQDNIANAVYLVHVHVFEDYRLQRAKRISYSTKQNARHMTCIITNFVCCYSSIKKNHLTSMTLHACIQQCSYHTIYNMQCKNIKEY